MLQCGRCLLDMCVICIPNINNKNPPRGKDTRTLVMAPQVTARIGTLPGGTEDETYCLR